MNLWNGSNLDQSWNKKRKSWDCLLSLHRVDSGTDLETQTEKTNSKIKEEQHQKSLYWICPNSEDVSVNKAMWENLAALNSMIESLKTQVEKEDPNCDLLLKSVCF